MKYINILLLLCTQLIPSFTNAQFHDFLGYDYQINRTSLQLIEKLKTDSNLTVLNPTLNCVSFSNATYKGDGSLLLDTGIVLVAGDVRNFFMEGYGSRYLFDVAPMDTLMDEDINAMIWAWGVDSSMHVYLTCKLEFDLVPKTDTIKIDYQFVDDLFGDTLHFKDYGNLLVRPGCRPAVNPYVILVSGGSEAYHKQNFAVIPGTDIPVNSFTTLGAGYADSFINCREGLMEGWEDCPYREYLYSTVDSIDSLPKLLSTKMEAVVPTTPCDTYHIKLATGQVVFYYLMSDFPPGTLDSAIIAEEAPFHVFPGSSFFLGNLRGVGTVYECEAPAGIEMPKSSLLLHLYPNPARESINIDLSAINIKEGTSLRIYDMLGKLVYTQVLPAFSTQLEVPVKDLAPGSYEVLIQTEQENHKAKFVKE